MTDYKLADFKSMENYKFYESGEKCLLLMIDFDVALLLDDTVRNAKLVKEYHNLFQAL